MREIYKIMLILSAAAICDGSYAWPWGKSKEEKERIEKEKERREQREAETLKVSKNEDITKIAHIDLISGKRGRDNAFFHHLDWVCNLQTINKETMANLKTCPYVKTIKITSSTLEHINIDVFAGWDNLHEIDLSGCSKLNTIDANAFRDCSALYNIKLPESLKRIGNNAFNGCKCIEKLMLPNTLEYIGSEAFSGCYNVQEIDLSQCQHLGKIDDRAFLNCRNLTKVMLNCKALGMNVFSGCANLESVDFSHCSKLTTIGQDAFAEYRDDQKLITFKACEKLKTIDLSQCKDLLYISDNTFDGCIGLESVKIGCQMCAIGKNAFKGCEKLRNVILNRELQTIESRAFYGCIELENVELKQLEKLTTIGDYAFCGCNKLQNINLSECWILTDIGIGAFKNCQQLMSVPFNKAIKNIGNEAFAGCENLNIEVNYGESGKVNELPKSMENIGDKAFYGCKSLNLSKIMAKSIGDNAFEGCLNLNIKKLSAGKIGNAAFKNTGIEEITVSIKEGGDYCFEECQNLTKLLLFNAAKWGVGCFKNCKNLKRVEFDYDVRDIEKSMFEGCTALEIACYNPYGNIFGIGDHKRFGSIGTPKSNYMFDGLENVGDSAFKGCENLAFLPLKYNENLKIGNEAFAGCKEIEILSNIEDGKSVAPVEIGAHAFNGCKKFKSVFLHKIGTALDEKDMNHDATNNKTIRNATFQNCTALTSTILQKNVTSIGDNAYDGCTNLKRILLPSTLTTIGKEAFKNCSALTELTIPANVGKIGENAFLGCGNIKHITCFAENYKIVINAIKCISSTLQSVNIVGWHGNKDKNLASVLLNNNIAREKLHTYKDDLFPIYSDKIEGKLEFGMLNAVSDFKTIRLKDDNLKKIGPMAFYGMKNLESIEFPKNVTTIDVEAFEGCDKLSEIIVPKGAFFNAANSDLIDKFELNGMKKYYTVEKIRLKKKNSKGSSNNKKISK